MFVYGTVPSLTKIAGSQVHLRPVLGLPEWSQVDSNIYSVSSSFSGVPEWSQVNLSIDLVTWCYLSAHACLQPKTRLKVDSGIYRVHVHILACACANTGSQMSGGSLYEIYKAILVNAAKVLSTFAGVEPENLDEECVLIYLRLQQKSSAAQCTRQQCQTTQELDES